MRPWLLITCGYPFSGKSTLAHEVAEGLDMALVAVDEQQALEIDLTSGNPSDRDWLRAYRAAYAQIEWQRAAGRSVVFDSVGFRRRDRDRARRFAARSGARSAVIWLDVSPEQARQRREQNLASPTRPQVPVKSFERIVAEFEPPDDDELTAKYQAGINPAVWVEQVLRPFLVRQDGD